MGGILVVRLDNMGDVLMCTPALQALRTHRPQARLTLLTSPSGAALAPHLDMVDEVIAHRAAWVKHAEGTQPDSEAALLARLRESAFEQAFILTTCTQSALPMALLCHMAGVPERLAHSRENPYALLSTWARETDSIHQGMRHEVQRQLDLLSLAGVPSGIAPPLRFKVLAPDRERIQALLLQQGLRPHAPYIVLHPGATAASRRYPTAAYAQVVAELCAGGWTCVLAGEQEAHEVAAHPLLGQALRQPGGRLLDLSSRLTLGELGALIDGASLFIGNNSGPMHLAAALGTPVVCLYAQTNPQHTPWAVPSRVLMREVPCSPCLQSRCPHDHHPCLREILPDEVVRAARDLLDESCTHAHQAAG